MHRCRGARPRAPRHHQALRRRCRPTTPSTSRCAAARSTRCSGENGAGKSTLMNVVYGHAHARRGRDPASTASRSRSARRARRWTTASAWSSSTSCSIPVMTVAENLVLGDEPRRGGLLDLAGARRRVRELSERYGLAVDPDARVEDITVGQQQRVEILRALDRGARGPRPRRADRRADRPGDRRAGRGAARAARRRARRSSSSPTSCSEVLEVADRVTVLRRGKKRRHRRHGRRPTRRRWRA